MFDTGFPGVSFQPGSGANANQDGSNGRPNQSNGDGFQQAIKVLSLRLPKVVGAQAMSPNALLTSPGSGGNTHIDSIINRVWSKFFPDASPAASASDFGFAGGPHFTGSIGESSAPQYTAPMRMPSAVDRLGQYPTFPAPPRIVPGDAPPDDQQGPAFPAPPTVAPPPAPSPVPDPFDSPFGSRPYEI